MGDDGVAATAAWSSPELARRVLANLVGAFYVLAPDHVLANLVGPSYVLTPDHVLANLVSASYVLTPDHVLANLVGASYVLTHDQISNVLGNLAGAIYVLSREFVLIRFIRCLFPGNTRSLLSSSYVNLTEWALPHALASLLHSP